MPITRRKRVSPQEQPESTNQAAAPAETEGASVPPAAPESTEVTEARPVTRATRTVRTAKAAHVTDKPSVNATDATNNTGAAYSPAESPGAPATPTVSATSFAGQTVNPAPSVASASQPASNGDRSERSERNDRYEMPMPPQAPISQGYAPTIEGGRRTSRGELFRRPPQMPPSQQMQQMQPQQSQPVPMPPQAAPLQPPTHEISLPLGNLLHLAYNPGYTGADEARSALLHKLENESKAGGRARCWNCGSIAIVYDRWATRSKTFGDVGVAFCEICGVWSVL